MYESPLLSIIVPVYNVRGYLFHCIDSICSQTAIIDGDVEVVAVDDGSTDGSGDVLRELVSRYPCLKVISPGKNGGLSAARNTGLAAASGKYVLFVDSDDYLEPDVLKGLLAMMETDELDVLRFNYRSVSETGVLLATGDILDEYVGYSTSIVDGREFLSKHLGYGCYAWQFIIRRDLMMSNGLQFRPGMYFEDTEWTPRMLCAAHRVRSVDTIAYNYVQRVGSITCDTSLPKMRKSLEDKITLVGLLLEQMSGEEDHSWYEGMICSTVISVLDMVSIHFFSSRGKYLTSLDTLGVYPLSSYHIGVRALKKVKLINLSPALYCWLIHLKNS